MVEMMRRSVLEGVSELKLRSSIKVAALAPKQRWILRVGAEGSAEAGVAFGVDLAQVPCRAVASGEKSAVWLGPDEWLLIAPVDTAAPVVSAPHSLVDVSHRQTAMEVSGTRAVDLLNTGVMLDLRLSAFPMGMCARTLLGKADVVLWRKETQVFHLEVWRSFAPYVHEFLIQASLGL
jgi:sarcosine oxidase, subunit gamma